MSVTLTPLILTGDEVPGTAGARFGRLSFMSKWALSSSGEAIVNAVLDVRSAGANSSSDEVLLHGRPGQLSLLAREGDAAPGTGFVFDGFLGLLAGMDDSGNVLISALLRDAELGTQSGLWFGKPGSFSLIARQGQAPPGSPNESFTTFATTQLVLDRSGKISFINLLQKPSDDFVETLFSGPAAALSRIIGAGDPAPGFKDGSLVSKFFDLTASRSALFYAVVAQHPQSLVQVEAIVNASIGTIARSDQMFESVPLGAMRQGDLAVYPLRSAGSSVLFGAGTTSSQPHGQKLLLSSESSGLEAIHRADVLLPGSPPGAGKPLLESFPKLGGGGHIAFGAGFDLPDGRKSGIWVKHPGESLHRLAFQGEPAPGFPDGFVFGPFATESINAKGEVLVFNLVRDTNTKKDFAALYLADATNSLHLVLRQGQSLVVRGISREIAGTIICLPGTTEDGRFTSFNDGGEMLLQIDFVDGTSGLFLAAMAAQPQVASPLLSPESVRYAGGKLSLELETISGRSYTLQFKSSLAAQEWHDVVTVPGDGTRLTLDDVQASEPERFYRVRITAQ